MNELFESADVGRRFRILTAVSTASAQNTASSFALMSIGRILSRIVLFMHSKMPFDDEE